MAVPVIIKDSNLAWAERLEREQRHAGRYIVTQLGKEFSPESDPYNKAHVAPFSDRRTPFAPAYSSWALAQINAESSLLESPMAVEGLSSRTPPPKSGTRERSMPASAASHRSAGNLIAPGGEELAEQELQRRALTRHSHSASAPQLQRGAVGRQRTGASNGRSSQHSLRSSHLSRASLRSQIGEAVQREIARTALGDYYAALEAKEQRQRAKILEMPIALRPAPGPCDMGCPTTKVTEQMENLRLPIQMQTDPKWSTDIKRINGKVGQRLEYERKLSGSVTGAMLPEIYYMPPKDFITNPPTPYFEPGKAGHLRRSV